MQSVWAVNFKFHNNKPIMKVELLLECSKVSIKSRIKHVTHIPELGRKLLRKLSQIRYGMKSTCTPANRPLVFIPVKKLYTTKIELFPINILCELGPSSPFGKRCHSLRE